MRKTSSEESISSFRWVVLACFMFVALLSQLLWLTFAPITSGVAKIFHVTEFEISLLSLVWPLVFVILAIPVGIFIDKKGFKISVGIGALLLAIFSVFRIFSTVPDYNYSVLLISQTGAAISQPFIFGCITKIAINWFSEKDQGLATGLGSIGLFIGMMLAFAITPFLFSSLGITKMLMIYALISCAGAFFFIFFAKERKVTTATDASSGFNLKDLWELSKLKGFIIIEFGFFVVVGGFTAIMTWLEPFLKSLHRISPDQAGIIGGLMILGGIIGSIIIPVISDRVNKIKPFVLLDLAIGTLAVFLIGSFDSFISLGLIFFIGGFFLMSALPLVLEISSRISGPGMEGRASSLLWFFSQVGSVFLIVIVDPVYSLWGSYYHSILLIVILWLISFLLFFTMSEVSRSIKT
jgi:predicted MFS family arabinose efflux permease